MKLFVLMLISSDKCNLKKSHSRKILETSVLKFVYENNEVIFRES